MTVRAGWSWFMWMDRQNPEGKGLDKVLNSWDWRDTAAARDMF